MLTESDDDRERSPGQRGSKWADIIEGITACRDTGGESSSPHWTQGARLRLGDWREIVAALRRLAEMEPAFERLARLADTLREQAGDQPPPVRDHAADLDVVEAALPVTESSEEQER